MESIWIEVFNSVESMESIWIEVSTPWNRWNRFESKLWLRGIDRVDLSTPWSRHSLLLFHSENASADGLGYLPLQRSRGLRAPLGRRPQSAELFQPEYRRGCSSKSARASSRPRLSASNECFERSKSEEKMEKLIQMDQHHFWWIDIATESTYCFISIQMD